MCNRLWSWNEKMYKRCTYAADVIPHIIQKPLNGFIANTDRIHGPGQHWVAFYLNEYIISKCFNSYGVYSYEQGRV